MRLKLERDWLVVSSISPFSQFFTNLPVVAEWNIGCSCLWGCFSIHILSVDQSSKQFWFIDKYHQISTSLPPLISLLDFLKPINNPWNISIVLHLSLNFILFSFISRWNTPTRLPSKSKTHEISPLLLYYILHGWFNPFLYGLNQHFTSHIHVKIYI
jgi:hypothetical protein